jgi:hypothetical protein
MPDRRKRLQSNRAHLSYCRDEIAEHARRIKRTAPEDR